MISDDQQDDLEPEAAEARATLGIERLALVVDRSNRGGFFGGGHAPSVPPTAIRARRAVERASRVAALAEHGVTYAWGMATEDTHRLGYHAGRSMIRTSTCSSPRWTGPPHGTRRSGCGRGSAHTSASLMVSGCSTWAAASGRHRSHSPRISANTGSSSASTRPSGCCASPVPTPEPHAVACASSSATRCSLDEPDASFDAARSERTLQWLADPAAAVAEMVRVVRPGGRISLIDTDWSTFTIDVGDDALAALGPRRDANGAQSTLQRRQATARPPRGGAAAFRSPQPTRRRPGRPGTRTRRRLRLVASRWRASRTTSSPAISCRPRIADRFVSTIHDAARRGQFSMRLTMFAVVAATPSRSGSP